MFNLRDMTDVELRNLNITIVDELNHRRNVKNQTVKAQFRIGDDVKFNSRNRGLVEGKIVKINSKTIVVKSGFTNWKVSPGLLSKA